MGKDHDEYKPKKDKKEKKEKKDKKDKKDEKSKFAPEENARAQQMYGMDCDRIRKELKNFLGDEEGDRGSGSSASFLNMIMNQALGGSIPSAGHTPGAAPGTHGSSGSHGSTTEFIKHFVMSAIRNPQGQAALKSLLAALMSGDKNSKKNCINDLVRAGVNIATGGTSVAYPPSAHAGAPSAPGQMGASGAPQAYPGAASQQPYGGAPYAQASPYAQAPPQQGYTYPPAQQQTYPSENAPYLPPAASGPYNAAPQQNQAPYYGGGSPYGAPQQQPAGSYGGPQQHPQQQPPQGYPGAAPYVPGQNYY